MTRLEPTEAEARNAAALELEIAWFSQRLDARLRAFFEPGEAGAADSPAPPELDPQSAYGAAVAAAGLEAAERLVAILALLPWLRPEALDPLLMRNPALERGYTEFGAAPGGGGSGFRPTRETGLFLLAGRSLAERFAAMRLFELHGALSSRRVLAIKPGRMAPCTPLEPHPRWLDIAVGSGTGDEGEGAGG